jgi:hypothetical protein
MIYLCFKLIIIFALPICFHCVLVKFPMGPQHVPNIGSSTSSQYWVFNMLPTWILHKFPMGPQHVPNIGSSTSSQYWVFNMLPTWILHKFPILGLQHVANMDPPQVPNGSLTCSQHWIFHLKFPMVPQHVPNIGSSTWSSQWVLNMFPIAPNCPKCYIL